MDDVGEWGVMHRVLHCRIELPPVNRISFAIWVTGSNARFTELEIMASWSKFGSLFTNVSKKKKLCNCTAFYLALE